MTCDSGQRRTIEFAGIDAASMDVPGRLQAEPDQGRWGRKEGEREFVRDVPDTANAAAGLDRRFRAVEEWWGPDMAHEVAFVRIPDGIGDRLPSA